MAVKGLPLSWAARPQPVAVAGPPTPRLALWPGGLVLPKASARPATAPASKPRRTLRGRDMGRREGAGRCAGPGRRLLWRTQGALTPNPERTRQDLGPPALAGKSAATGWDGPRAPGLVEGEQRGHGASSTPRAQPAISRTMQDPREWADQPCSPLPRAARFGSLVAGEQEAAVGSRKVRGRGRSHVSDGQEAAGDEVKDRMSPEEQKAERPEQVPRPGDQRGAGRHPGWGLSRRPAALASCRPCLFLQRGHPSHFRPSRQVVGRGPQRFALHGLHGGREVGAGAPHPGQRALQTGLRALAGLTPGG